MQPTTTLLGWPQTSFVHQSQPKKTFGRQTIRPLPAGTALDAAFLLVKLDDGNWCARQIGDDYNRVEFLGQLSAYTHSLLKGEADRWYDDDDAPPPAD